MISASSMVPGKNGPQQPPSHGILKTAIPLHSLHPHGGQVMDSRMRMDAQKFLVPSLPLSGASRHESAATIAALKRKDRSLLNGNILQDRENARRYDTQRLPQQGQQHSPRQRESVSPYSEMIHQSQHYQLPPNPANYQLGHPSVSSTSPNSVSPKTMSPPNKSSGRGSFSPGNHGELNLSSRLYPSHSSNGFHSHPSLGMQGHHAAFFAAAAAAAAAGSPYPLFGGPSPYIPHSHAAASSYLDSFHSGILAQQQQMKGGGSISSGSASNYLPQHLRIPYHPHATSTTSLHTNLIESSSESRYNGHTHLHHPGIPRNGEYPMAVSKGGPLGMGPLDPPLQMPPAKKPTSMSEGSGQRTWSERDLVIPYGRQFAKLSPTEEQNQYELIRADSKLMYPSMSNREREGGAYRQRMVKPSHESEESASVRSNAKPKQSNIFTFPPEVPLAQRNGHGSAREKDGLVGLDLQKNNDLGHVQNPFQPPESPKKRKAPTELQWNYAMSQQLSKQGQKTLSVPSSPSYLKSPPSTLLVPSSPSYYKIPKSPSVTFKTGPKVPPSPKKVLQTHNENTVHTRSLLLAPIPVEQMPVLEAFRHGSLIQLASGEVKSVENLCGEDFTHSAAQMLDTVKIVYCKVLAVQEVMPARTSSNAPPFCKITLGMESHKQQVVLDSTLEQPFFVLGRGWSSLSPEMSKKLLQLQCSSLQVGDICMTLAKTPGKPHLPAQGLKPRNCPLISNGAGATTVNQPINTQETAPSKTNSTAAENESKVESTKPPEIKEERRTSLPGTIESTTSTSGDNVTGQRRSSVSPETMTSKHQPQETVPETPASTTDTCGSSSPKKRRLSNPQESETENKKTEESEPKRSKSPETLMEEIEVD